jgi:hypothetical protein
MRILLFLFVFALLTTEVRADRNMSDACAASLPDAEKQVYDGTMAGDPTPETARSIVVAQVKKLIGEGKLSLAEGRTAGEAAGKCLELLEK